MREKRQVALESCSDPAQDILLLFLALPGRGDHGAGKALQRKGLKVLVGGGVLHSGEGNH